MSSSEIPHPSEPNVVVPGAKKIWTVGTLSYDRRALVILFFWLMWNDFSIMQLEGLGGAAGILMHDQGANLTQMAILGMSGFFLPLLNPWVSTWSDRHRGRWGRRRPFLLFSAPLFALFHISFPYMPTVYHHVEHNPFVVFMVRHLPDHMDGEVFFMGLSSFFARLFNTILMGLFGYLYWDVVPQALMGRFQSLSKIATQLSGLVWSFWLVCLVEYHSKTVFLWTGLFCLVVYMVSTWQIKEGEYPPPDSHEKLEVLEPINAYFFVIYNPVLIKLWAKLAPVRAYFVECYSQPYFLWIFMAIMFTELGNMGGGAISWYLRYDLNIPLQGTGWANGTSNLTMFFFIALFGFFLGSATDRFKPVRLMAPLVALIALGSLSMYFFVHDVRSYLIWSIVRGPIGFWYAITFVAMQVTVYPREKLGQFCSAQALFYLTVITILTLPVGYLFDFLHNHFVNGYRLGYLWEATFRTLSAICYVKVYLNWKERHGQVPVPHAG